MTDLTPLSPVPEATAVAPASSGTHAPGFYDDGHGVRRWWDGRAWTQHVEGGAAVAPVTIAAAVAGYSRAGFAIVSMTETSAVLRKVPKLNLPLNLLVALCTGGIWLIVMVARYSSRERRAQQVVLTVVNGNVVRS